MRLTEAHNMNPWQLYQTKPQWQEASDSIDKYYKRVQRIIDIEYIKQKRSDSIDFDSLFRMATELMIKFIKKYRKFGSLSSETRGEIAFRLTDYIESKYDYHWKH